MSDIPLNNPGQILWEQKPSQAINWPFYLGFIIIAFFWPFLPFEAISKPIQHGFSLSDALWVYSAVILMIPLSMLFRTLCTRYEFTSERLLIYSGVLNRQREEIELYRVKDFRVSSPLYIRLFGLSNIQIHTSDRTKPVVILQGIYNSYKVADLMRDQVEIKRTQKGVREFD